MGISFNVNCDNCSENAKLAISNQNGYLKIECLGCGDILKIKDALLGDKE